jgi:hypothetical protein
VFENVTYYFFQNKGKEERTVCVVLPEMVSVDLKTVNLGKDVESFFEFGAPMEWIHP